MNRDELRAMLCGLLLGRTAPKGADAVLDRLETLGVLHLDGPPRVVEPTAGARSLARVYRDNYDALIGEGFTEPQALHLLGALIAAARSE